MAEHGKAEKSALPIRLIIKKKYYDMVIEAKISDIYNELDAIVNLEEKLQEKGLSGEEGASIEQPQPEEVESTPTGDIPTIKSVKSTIENIKLLFKTPWGKTPRSAAEVIKSLQVNGIYDKPEAVGTYLLRLTQRQELRRIDKEGKWQYVAIPS